MHANHYRARRPLTLLLVLTMAALLILTALVASACSSGPNTYTDEDFNFSFEYPSGWQIQHVPPADLLPGVAKEVGAFDLRGSDAGNDATWDMMSVEVYQGGKDLDNTLEGIELSLTDYLLAMQEADPSLEVLETPTPVTIGGLSGYKISYKGYAKGDQLRVTEYTLLAETVTYTLWTQSTVGNWESNQGVFTDFLDTFTPGD